MIDFNPHIHKNFIVKTGREIVDDAHLFFNDEPVEFLEDNVDMADILVKCDVFITKSQARKNWKRTPIKIPEGFTVLENVGQRRLIITILNITK